MGGNKYTGDFALDAISITPNVEYSVRCIGDCDETCSPNMTTAVSTRTDLVRGAQQGGYTIEVAADIDVSCARDWLLRGPLNLQRGAAVAPIPFERRQATGVLARADAHGAVRSARAS